MTNYCRIKEVAALYGVSEELVYQWVQKGLLKPVLIPNLNRNDRSTCYGFDRDQLADFDPIINKNSMWALNKKELKREQNFYTDYLDKREQDLYDEICFINEMKKYLKDIEPYL